MQHSYIPRRIIVHFVRDLMAYLVFGIERDDAGFMRTHDRLAGFDDVRICFAL